MKKVVLFLLSATLLLSTWAAPASALVAGPTPLNVLVDGKKVTFPDTQPFTDAGGRTLVPVRFITEQLGAQVQWLAESQTAVIRHQDLELRLTAGQRKARVGQKEVELDTEATLKGGRLFVPLRFVAESLEAKVQWDAGSQTIRIVTAAALPAGDKVRYDPWGRLIRTTNLPKNADEWPYILADLPNEMYELPVLNGSDGKKRLSSAALFQDDLRYTQEIKNGWTTRIRSWFTLAFNVDYQTITDDWADEINRYQFIGFDQRYLYRQEYIPWLKENHVQVEGWLEPEPSMIYQDEYGDWNARSRFAIRFNHFDEPKDLLLYVHFWQFGLPKEVDAAGGRWLDIKKFSQLKQGVWYEGYLDVDLTTNSWDEQWTNLGVTGAGCAIGYIRERQ